MTYKYLIGNYNDKVSEIKRDPLKFWLIMITGLVIYLPSLRGFGASIRSVVFDSTIRYFKDFSLLPSAPVIIMDINILLLGISSVIFSVIILYFIIKYSGNKLLKGKYIVIGVIFILVQSAAFLYDFLQDEPQGTPLIRIIYITLTFALTILIFHSKKNIKYILLYFALAASVISVSYLSSYNSEIEKESLKTTAGELTRTNQNVVEFMIYQTMVQVQQNTNISGIIKNTKRSYI